MNLRDLGLRAFPLAILAAACGGGSDNGAGPGPGPTRDDGGGTVEAGPTDNTPPDASDARDAGPGTQPDAGGCTAAETTARWAKAVAAPVAPPRGFGNIDLAGDDSWRGLTLEEANRINCTAIADGDGAAHWGPQGEIKVTYDTTTHLLTGAELHAGYTGKIIAKGRQPASGQPCFNYADSQNVRADATCPNQKDTYEIGVATLPLKNGAPYVLDPQAADYDTRVTELSDAVLSTFAPDQASAASCLASGACLELLDDGTGVSYFGFRPLALYFAGDAKATTKEARSTPSFLYTFFLRLLPFSNAPISLQLNAVGPTARVAVGPGGLHVCNVQLGTTFQELVDNCVRVNGVAKYDDVNFAKLVGGRAHTLDDVLFHTSGLNASFTMNEDTFGFVKDSDLPAKTDLATEWSLDVRARGAVANDLNPTSRSYDLHGTGLVVREFLRLAQREIYRTAATPPASQHTIGDPACLGASPAAGCTGLEGAMIPGPAVNVTTTPPYDGGAAENKQQVGRFFGAYRSFLKPGGTPGLFFCTNPATAATGDLAGGGCDGDVAKFLPNSLWDGAYRAVLKTLGKGDPTKLPVAARDARFYYQQYALALTKYLRVYGVRGDTATLNDVATVTIDLEDVAWDVADDKQLDAFSYVERGYIAAGSYPMTLHYAANLKTADQPTTSFVRRLSRAEASVYSAMNGQSTSPLGQLRNVRITNLFGSRALSDNWEKLDCATGVTVDCPASALGPWDGASDFHENGMLDSRGAPLLATYPGAWRPTVFHPGASPLRITGFVDTSPVAHAAKVSLPAFADPYDATSAVRQLVQALVAHTPSQAAAAIAIPMSATSDRAVPADDLAFTGATASFHLRHAYTPCQEALTSTACNAQTQQAYLCDKSTVPAAITTTSIAPDPACRLAATQPAVGHDTYCCDGRARAASIPTENVKVLAIEASSFTGDVFLCADPNTGHLLRARSYDAAEEIAAWLDRHPGAAQACTMIVRRSATTNAIEKIASHRFGVTLDMSQSFGSARVKAVTLWDPALGL